MSGFADPIVGGIGNLIRQYIRSPNYVANVSGWTINKDGSAEFNNLTVRGQIILTPIPTGQVIGNIWWNDGQSAPAAIFEENVSNGLWFSGAADATAGASNNGALFIGKWSSAGGSMGLQANVLNDNGLAHHIGTPGHHGFQMDNTGPGGANSVNMGRSGGLIKTTANVSYQIGPGQTGKYYFEEITAAGLVIPSGVLTALAGLVASHLSSDYGSAFNLVTGVWTCPVTGVYKVNLNLGYTAAAGGRGVWLINNTTTGLVFAQIDEPAVTGHNTTHGYGWITAGDTLTFSVLQTAGAARTTNTSSKISIGRDL